MAGQLLEFETEMFLSLFGCDGLLVAAEGLGIDRVLLQFMQVYSEKDSLVLLLNTTTPEQVRTENCPYTVSVVGTHVYSSAGEPLHSTFIYYDIIVNILSMSS